MRRWPFALATAALACGRGGSGEPRPVPALSSSTEAQAAFAPLRHAWSDPDGMARDELRTRLEQFLARFGGDGLGPLARVYLALVYLDAGDDARARVVLAPMTSLPPGATRDLATLALAKLLRRQGQPARAFELLQPLVGKLVDADARGVFGEELTLAAIESRHAYEAVAYMDGWLRAAPEQEREPTRAKAMKALERIEPDVLLGALRAMRTGSGSGYSADIQRIVTERLAAIAVERGDSELARWIVGGGRVTLSGDLAQNVGELATTTRGVLNVAGRTLGLLLPTRIVNEQDEAAEVIRGLAFALDLPRKDPSADELRLATRDGPPEQEMRDARLDELAGEGVAAVVTGLDPDAADGALRWAETRHVPVIVLAAPRTEKAGAWGFVLGEDRATQLSALASALVARKVTKIATVTEHDEPLDAAEVASLSPLVIGTRGDCEADPEHAAAAPFPLGEWRRENVRGWAVFASTECARSLARWLIGSASRPGVLALGLESSAAATDHPGGLSVLTVTAGAMPVMLGAPEPAEGIGAFVSRLGRAPEWWTAIGRDAGALARRAVASLPEDTTTSEPEVRRRREVTRGGLEQARAPLWTSEQRGFDGHVLHRHLGVLDVNRSAAPTKSAPGGG